MMTELPLAEIADIAQSHGSTSVKIFGSRARGTARADSDLDLLIGTKDGTTLFDVLRMEIALEELLGMRVEVVTEPGLRPEIKERVLRDAREIAA